MVTTEFVLSKALEMMNEAGFELYDLLDRCRALVTRDFDFFREKIGMAIAMGVGGQDFGANLKCYEGRLGDNGKR
ncbi:MAG: hypothetical protein QXK03_05175 [Archaeoglobaceae archaeon]